MTDIICGFCGTRAEDAEMLLQSQTHQGTFICSWCVESTMPAIAKYRRTHGWKRQAPPTTQPKPENLARLEALAKEIKTPPVAPRTRWA